MGEPDVARDTQLTAQEPDLVAVKDGGQLVGEGAFAPDALVSRETLAVAYADMCRAYPDAQIWLRSERVKALNDAAFAAALEREQALRYEYAAELAAAATARGFTHPDTGEDWGDYGARWRALAEESRQRARRFEIESERRPCRYHLGRPLPRARRVSRRVRVSRRRNVVRTSRGDPPREPDGDLAAVLLCMRAAVTKRAPTSDLATIAARLAARTWGGRWVVLLQPEDDETAESAERGVSRAEAA